MARVYIKPPNQKRDLSLNFSHTNKTQTRMTITIQKKTVIKVIYYRIRWLHQTEKNNDIVIKTQIQCNNKQN